MTKEDIGRYSKRTFLSIIIEGIGIVGELFIAQLVEKILLKYLRRFEKAKLNFIHFISFYYFLLENLRTGTYACS